MSAPPSFTTAGSVAVAAGVAQRMADGSVVFRGPPSAFSAPPVVQRETGPGEPPPPEPAGEPTDAGGGAGGDPAAVPVPAPVEQGQGGQGPGGAPPVKVTDELVRALYAPLSRLLRADLRLERERAGFLIDTRH